MRAIDGDALKRKTQKVATEAWKMRLTAKIETTLNQFIDWIDEQPTVQPEPQWILCSDRLPDEERKTYWVCTNTGYQCECRWTDNIYGLGSIGDKWGWSICDVPQYSYVVAWRELTESFKGIDDE